MLIFELKPEAVTSYNNSSYIHIFPNDFVNLSLR